MWNLVLAQAQDAAQGTAEGVTDGAVGAGAAPQAQMPSMLFMVVAFFFIMYLFMIRPNQKREKERKEMLASVAKGDKIVTTGGICGTVVGLSEKIVVVRVTNDEPGVKMEFLREAIMRVASREKSAKE